MRKLLWIAVLLSLAGSGPSGTIDSRDTGPALGTVVSPATGPVCLAGQQLQLDSACTNEYIKSDGAGTVGLYVGGYGRRYYYTASDWVSFGKLTLLYGPEQLQFGSSGAYGKVCRSSDDGMILGLGTDGSGNSRLILDSFIRCGSNHGNSTMALFPELKIYSGTGDFTEWGAVHHDGGSFVIETGTGPAAFKTGIQPESEDADPCADDQYPARSIFHNGVSDYMCFCNASNVAKQVHSPATDCF